MASRLRLKATVIAFLVVPDVTARQKKENDLGQTVNPQVWREALLFRSEWGKGIDT